MRLLLITLLFVFPQLNGQSWFYKREIDWKVLEYNEKRENFEDVINFSNSYIRNFEDVFPHYFEIIEWEKPVENFTLSFFRTETEIIPGDLIPKEYLNQLSHNFEIQYSKAVQSRRHIIQYSILPFRINPVSGNAERLKSFVLQADVRQNEEYTGKNLKKSAMQSDSPLATGDWYKVRVSQEGIHKISYEQIQNIGITNPADAEIYGYGGAQLSEDNSLGKQDEFIKIPVYMEKGSDGIFNSGDYLLFFATGMVSWEYDEDDEIFVHNKNPYSDYGYYFITSGPGSSSPPDLELSQDSPDYVSESFDQLLFHEEDEINMLESGKEWYGELFDITTQRTFGFNIPGLITSSDIYLKTNLLGRSKENSKYYIYANDQILDTAEIRSTNPGSYTATFAYTSSEVYSFMSLSENVDIRLSYIKPDASAQGWLDYLALNARSDLRLNDDELIFRDKNSFNYSVTEYKIKNSSSSTIVWEVAEYPAVRNVPGQLNGNVFSFKVAAERMNKFIAFDKNGNFPSVEFDGEGLGIIENQNLKGSGFPDLVIITHKDFTEAAERLASYRRERNELDVVVTTPEEIYNEFSSGRPDVTALRNYMSWLYNTAGSNEDLIPRYLLLFGDASYIFKSNDPVDGNFVPTYQSNNSLNPISSFLSDDFFGLLDEGESITTGLLDIGIGRLPVNSIEQAEIMVDKIISYESPERLGEWRNSIVFIGDDQDNNIHFNQADELARYVETNYPAFNVNKIYLDAYQQVSTPVGTRYPEVNAAINNQVNKGALIINYTGHGGTKGLADERILGLNDIQSWENQGKLPLFMTATCEFSRFDKPDIVSAGEQVILSPKGGGIALLTTTRLVYSAPNHFLNEKFYEIVFEKTEDGKNYCLGDIMKYTKTNSGVGINKRNFTLLGDPAMRLAYPFHNVVLDSINQMDVQSGQDTLRALSTVTISGRLEDYNGDILEEYNGVIYSTVFDKPSEQTTLANDNDSRKANFNIRNNIIHKGKATVKDGRFNVSFIVPKDINYAYGPGKISFYANDSTIDASGAYLDFIVGGSGQELETDSQGPEIEVFMNNEFFMTGGITNQNPVLFVKVFDDYGINTTGTGIGHDITATINGNTQNTIVLNEFYQSDLDSYQSGTVTYPLFNLEAGRYEIEVKVWDIFNNSATGTTEFEVIESNEMLIDNLLNFPNPFRENTYFSFEHNKSGQDLDITIDIFNMNGSLVRTIKAKEYGSGFRSQPIYWDGRSEAGNYNRQGVYLYRIRVNTSDGEQAQKTGRLIIIR